MFVENIEKLQAEVDDLRGRIEDWERRHAEATSALRTARQEAHDANEQAEKASLDVKGRDRVISDLRRAVENTVLLEQRANAAEDKLRDLVPEVARLEAELAVSDGLLRTAESLRDAAEDNLTARSDEFDRAQELLAAFKARSEANRVIAG